MPPTVVIVGASLAGASAAATLRQEGFDGNVMLVGAEPQLPYKRPALSKQYLRGETPFEKMLVRPAAFYEQNRIETLSVDEHCRSTIDHIYAAGDVANHYH